jgi:hypothetical protein
MHFLMKSRKYISDLNLGEDDNKRFLSSHEDIAKVIAERGYKCHTLAMTRDLMEEDLYDDIRHCHQTSNHLVSELEARAREEMTNKYPHGDALDALFKKYDLKEIEVNYPQGWNEESKEDRDRKFKLQIEDAIFKAKEVEKYYDILDCYRDGCKHEYDDDGEIVRELSKEEFEEEWKRTLEKIVMPRTSVTYDRQYHLAPPFNHWDSRNYFQQWYIIEDDYNIYCVHGGSGGSGQREQMGRWGHTFAELVKKYDYAINTYCYNLNSRNSLDFVKQFDSYKVINIDLCGNYHSDRELMKELFSGLLINTKFEEIVD